MLPLVDSTVGALLAIQTQVNLTTLAADHRSESARAAAVPFAGVTEWNVALGDPNPVVIPHPLLAMELQFTAGTLQAAAFIAFKHSLVGTPAGVAFLTDEDCVHSFVYCWTLTTHVKPVRSGNPWCENK